MPKKYTKRRGKPIRSKYFKKYSTSSSYRKSKPRTLQIATRRNPNQVLRFVINQTYWYDGTKTPAGKTAVLQYRANSIFHAQVPSSSISGEFISQDPQLYSNYTTDNITQDADGWTEWSARYQHFCVLGSKIQSTFEPTTTGSASVHFHHLSGVGNAIDANSQMKDINKLPYTYRNSIVATTVQRGNTGSRMSQQYSAKKYEGVSNVQDNSNLRGSFGGGQPAEQTFFYLGIAPATQMTATSPNINPQGIIRVKVEYIVMLKEPTETNQVQVTQTSFTGGNSTHDEL